MGSDAADGWVIVGGGGNARDEKPGRRCDESISALTRRGERLEGIWGGVGEIPGWGFGIGRTLTLNRARNPVLDRTRNRNLTRVLKGAGSLVDGWGEEEKARLRLRVGL